MVCLRAMVTLNLDILTIAENFEWSLLNSHVHQSLPIQGYPNSLTPHQNVSPSSSLRITHNNIAIRRKVQKKKEEGGLTAGSNAQRARQSGGRKEGKRKESTTMTAAPSYHSACHGRYDEGSNTYTLEGLDCVLPMYGPLSHRPSRGVRMESGRAGARHAKHIWSTASPSRHLSFA